jgi:hypothetical protein
MRNYYEISCKLCLYIHPASYTMGTGGSFPGGNARAVCDADHSPPSSAGVKKGKLYLLSPQALSMACNGITLPFYLSIHKYLDGRLNQRSFLTIQSVNCVFTFIP